MNVADLLAAVAADAPAPTPSTVLADLDRGRSALGRRRRRRAIAGATLAVACVMGLTGLLQSHRDGDPIVGSAASPPAASPTAPAVDPFDYPAPPPPPASPFLPFTSPPVDGGIGFELIPQGWVVSGYGADQLTLVPADPEFSDSWIHVILEDGYRFPADAEELADGRLLTVETTPGEGTTELAIGYPGEALVVYFPVTRSPGWTTDEMFEFAAGLSVR